MSQLQISFTKKQLELYNAFNDPQYEEILFGGGARGGKTWGIASIVVATCISYPGIGRLMGRRERDDLKKTSLITLFKVLNTLGFQKVRSIDNLSTNGQYHINMQDKMLRFGNGSYIFLVPLKRDPSDPEYNRLGSYEITHARIDEAQEIERKAVDIINSRKTEKIKEYDLIGKTIMSCNPMKGHLYNDFIKPSTDGTILNERIFIPSLYKDNPYIDHAKYESSLANATKTTRERLLFGNREYDDNPLALVEYDKILDMRTNQLTDDNDTYYIVCDVARYGKDLTVVRIWKGWESVEMQTRDKTSIQDTIDLIEAMREKYGVGKSNCIVDEDGVGGGVVDVGGYKGFQGGSKAQEGNYQNLRTECIYKISKRIQTGGLRIAHDEHKEETIAEIEQWIAKDVDKDGKLKVQGKEYIKDRIGRSPDFSDTIMMREWFELNKQEIFFISL